MMLFQRDISSSKKKTGNDSQTFQWVRNLDNYEFV